MKLFALLFFIPLALLFSQSDDSWKVYSDSSLVRVDISIDTAKLSWIYNNVKSDSEHSASARIRSKYFDETYDSIGFRLRGNTSRDSKKKSFKVSFNSFIKGRKFHGIEKLNLNGEHNDPSIIRSKLCFDLYSDIDMPASRANHVQVFINGKYYGLYISVEHIDENFLKKNYANDGGNLWKCLYPADLKYLGADPNLYKSVMNNPTTRAYELSTNESKDDYTMFAKLVDVVNNTAAASFPDSIEKYADVRRFLQYFAMNTLVGSWDDYRSLMNNYYLYFEPTQKKFTIIPYDYDNTFGIDWFNVNWSTANPYNYPKAVSGARPLWEKLVANDQYRDLYTHFLQFYRDKVYSLPLWENRINRIKDSIAAAAEADSFRALDYGFTVSDFHNSYSASSYSKAHVKYGLKVFINARNGILPSQLNYKNSVPIAYKAEHAPLHPSPKDSLTVTASCFGSAGIKNVTIEYNELPLSSVVQYAMKFSPVANTKKVEDADRWIGKIPPIAAGKSARYRISMTDSLNRAQTFPRKGFIEIVSASPQYQSVVINEFMADNASIPDSAGQFDDWVELYNPTSAPVMLTNKFLTDKAGNYTKWKFRQPNLVLNPGEYLLVWCDEDSSQKGIHTNFKLSASGEFLAITDSDGVTILDSITFGPQKKDISFGRFPDGAALWGFMSATPNKQNTTATSVRREEIIPNQFLLSVFPNPFNPSTIIAYQIPNVGTVERPSHKGTDFRPLMQVSLKIYDILGKEIAALVNEEKMPGNYSVQFNASLLSSGIYFVRLQSGSFSAAQKIVLMK